MVVYDNVFLLVVIVTRGKYELLGYQIFMMDHMMDHIMGH